MVLSYQVSFSSSFPLSNLADNMGVRVMAATVEVTTVMVTIQPNSLNMTPIMPPTMVRGKNTATITKVDRMTETQTSLVA